MSIDVAIPQHSMDEKELIKHAQQGDLEAVAAIYSQHQPAVFTYIFYRVSDQDCAEDLTAEVFVRMLAKLAEYADQGRPLLSWLYTIARNLVVDYYRKTHERNSMPLKENLISSDIGHPVNETESQLAQECLARAMDQLTEEQRQVVLLKFVEERDIADVSLILGKNERAIRSLQHRALATLHRAMQKEHCYEF